MMAGKGSKQEWIDYFTSINGRPPSAAEIEAARDIYEDDGETAADSTAAGVPPQSGISGQKSADELKSFAAGNQWQISTGERVLVQPQDKLATTMAVATGLLGVLWIVIVVHLSSILGTIHQMGVQISLILQAQNRLDTTERNEIQKFESELTNPISTARMVAILLAVVMVILAVNYLFRIIKLKRPLFWLIGADAIGTISAVGGYLTLRNMLNTVVDATRHYTLNDLLVMGNSLITNVAESWQKSAGDDLDYFVSRIKPLFQKIAQYVTDVANSVHSVQNVLMILSVVATILAVAGVYLVIKGSWRTGEVC